MIAVGAIADSIGHEGDRLYRRMQIKLDFAGAVEAIMAGIVPNIAPTSPEAPQVNVVDVRFLPFLNTKMNSCLER